MQDSQSADVQLIEALQLTTRDLLGVALHSLDAAPGIRIHHMRLLIAAHENPGASSASLAMRLGISASSVTRQADWLCAAGYLQRDQLPQNRRVVVLSLTERGRDLVAKVLSRRAAVFASALPEVDPELRSALIDGLQALHAALSQVKQH